MPYNTDIAARIDALLVATGPVDMKIMFGGVCYLHEGNMFCGVYKDSLILRVGLEQGAKALAVEGARPFDITGRPMKGWVMVEQAAFPDERTLRFWLELAQQFVLTLPPK